MELNLTIIISVLAIIQSITTATNIYGCRCDHTGCRTFHQAPITNTRSNVPQVCSGTCAPKYVTIDVPCAGNGRNCKYVKLVCDCNPCGYVQQCYNTGTNNFIDVEVSPSRWVRKYVNVNTPCIGDARNCPYNQFNSCNGCDCTSCTWLQKCCTSSLPVDDIRNYIDVEVSPSRWVRRYCSTGCLQYQQNYDENIRTGQASNSTVQGGNINPN